MVSQNVGRTDAPLFKKSSTCGIFLLMILGDSGTAFPSGVNPENSFEAFQLQKVRHDERRGESSPERAIIAGRGNGSVGIALRVILSQISSPLGSGIRDKQLG